MLFDISEGRTPQGRSQPSRLLAIFPPHLLVLPLIQLLISDAAVWTHILSPEIALRAATTVLAHHHSYAEFGQPYTLNISLLISPPKRFRIAADDSWIHFTEETTWNLNLILFPATILLNSHVTLLAASLPDRVNPLGAPFDRTHVTSRPSLPHPYSMRIRSIGTSQITKSWSQATTKLPTLDWLAYIVSAREEEL